MPEIAPSVDNSASPMTPENLMGLLDGLGITYQLHHHKAVYSVAESNEVDTRIEGAHTRNLFLRDKNKKMVLLTLMAHTKIDLNLLAGLLGAGRLSFGSPERLMTYLGVTPGSVTPVSIINDTGHEVSLYLDKEMMEQEIINFHPLINTMTIGLKPEDLLLFLEKTGHKAQIIDLSPARTKEPD